MTESKAELASRAWQGLSDLVLDRNRKAAASEALGMSFARVRALRRLADEPQTLRGLAASLLADPPYITLIVDDLEKRGLVKRTPHPDDRRSKLVQLTTKGRAAAKKADAIMSEPPTGLRELSAADLSTLLRIVESLSEAESRAGRKSESSRNPELA